jgi:AraC family transcriptional regulator, transcriptional activator of the genes for pyochelin and ferripyochelin receptors
MKEGNNGVPINAKDEMKMHEAKIWLENNIDSHLTLPEIARLIGTNDFKLKKGFKQLFGTTVFDYLLKLRMGRAKQLLQDTDKPIHEIAFLTGYSSHSAFTNAFTRHFGYSPLYVRKK